MIVRRAGEAALLIEVDDFTTAQRVRTCLLRARIPGVRELVPGLRSLLLVADPLAVDLDELAAKLPAWDYGEAATIPGRDVDIPIHYDGPDLDATANLTGLHRDELIERHAASTYTVAFLGFSPGFPYLVGLDPRLQVPRLDTPRTRVPAGSVAMAGDMTAIYTRATPGGWRILGHTDLALFSPHRHPPALLAPGDRVHFVRQS